MKKKILKELTQLILITILVFVAFSLYNKSRYYEPSVVITDEGDELDIDVPILNFN